MSQISGKIYRPNGLRPHWKLRFSFGCTSEWNKELVCMIHCLLF